jgi:thiol:disulfide interchange protein
MNTKTLALLMFGILAFSACNTAPVETEVTETTPTTEVEVEVEVVEEEEPEISESAGVELVAFNQAEYDAAIASGKDVFLDFYASWCPTCVANHDPLVSALDASSNGNLVAFTVDYDNSDDLQEQYGILAQSSFVLIEGGDVSDFEILGPGLFRESNFADFIQ